MYDYCCKQTYVGCGHTHGSTVQHAETARGHSCQIILNYEISSSPLKGRHFIFHQPPVCKRSMKFPLELTRRAMFTLSNRNGFQVD